MWASDPSKQAVPCPPHHSKHPAVTGMLAAVCCWGQGREKYSNSPAGGMGEERRSWNRKHYPFLFAPLPLCETLILLKACLLVQKQDFKKKPFQHSRLHTDTKPTGHQDYGPAITEAHTVNYRFSVYQEIRYGASSLSCALMADNLPGTGYIFLSKYIYPSFQRGPQK